MADDSGGDKLVWFVAGAMVGAALGMLFAPKSGRELRKYLADKGSEGREFIEEAGRDLYDRGRELYEKGRGLAEDAAGVFERGLRREG